MVGGGPREDGISQGVAWVDSFTALSNPALHFETVLARWKEQHWHEYATGRRLERWKRQVVRTNERAKQDLWGDNMRDSTSSSWHTSDDEATFCSGSECLDHNETLRNRLRLCPCVVLVHTCAAHGACVPLSVRPVMDDHEGLFIEAWTTKWFWHQKRLDESVDMLMESSQGRGTLRTGTQPGAPCPFPPLFPCQSSWEEARMPMLGTNIFPCRVGRTPVQPTHPTCGRKSGGARGGDCCHARFGRLWEEEKEEEAKEDETFEDEAKHMVDKPAWRVWVPVQLQPMMFIGGDRRCVRSTGVEDVVVVSIGASGTHSTTLGTGTISHKIITSESLN